MTDDSVRAHAGNAVAAGGLSRRQLVKAGAWAAPAIALTAAVPAASASVPTPTTKTAVVASITADAPTKPRGSSHNAYSVTVAITNTGTVAGSFTASLSTTDSPAVVVSASPAAQTIDPGATGFFVFTVTVGNQGKNTYHLTAGGSASGFTVGERSGTFLNGAAISI